jgi:NAD+ kinase
MKKIWIYVPNTEEWIQNKKNIFISALKNEGIQILNEISNEVELAVGMGGDGSLLAMIRDLKEWRSKIPVTGIHCSQGLGFLHPLALPENDADIPAWAKKFASILKNKDFVIQKRWGLRTSLLDNRENKKLIRKFWSMNDCVLSKGSLSRMVRLKVEIDGTVLYERLRGDGLIISTATGSTAYAFSAGGPVISPELECLLLVPICPHEISNRPVLLGPDVKLDIEILDSKSPCFLTEDGQSGLELEPGQILSIHKEAEAVQWWIPRSDKINTKNYYEILREKLGFGMGIL